MKHKMMHAVIRIEGMTCVNCENHIENALSKTPGIETVNVSYTSGKAIITYNENVIDRAAIEHIIESNDYQVRRSDAKIADTVTASKVSASKSQTSKAQVSSVQASKVLPSATKASKANIRNILGIVIILAALFMVINRFGGFNVFNSFPQAGAGDGLWPAFPDRTADLHSLRRHVRGYQSLTMRHRANCPGSRQK